jgi:hypothetical protein
MKKLLFAILLITFTLKLSAQQKPVPMVQPPLPFREVSGVVKDDKGETVIGALVTLKSVVDTLRTATNDDGIFVFKNVKKAAFNVTVSYIGSETFVKKYLNNDLAKKIILDPITLKPQSNQLNEVTINGTPSVVYKTDTVEYRASDYKVRANATLDELIKKMEGMEVGNDGSLLHQGENVVQAKLNGKTFNSGSISQALKNLPADIVEKIQIVDDYGDQAARTGIKTGLPQKILNITTKPDRSVGTQGRLVAQAGNNDRYNFNLSGTRINANQVIGVNANLRNTVDGIGGGNPGTTLSGSPSISYRDQWSKKVQVNSSYSYDFNNNNSINHQYGNDPTTLGVRYFDQQGSNNNSSRGHSARFQMEINLDSLNYLQFTPSIGKSHSNNESNNRRDQIDDFRDPKTKASLFQHQLSQGSGSNYNENNSYNFNVFFLHKFMKPKRNISASLNISNSKSQADGGSNRLYKFYGDSTLNKHIKDSTINVLSLRNNKNTSYSGRVSFSEPLGEFSLIDFTADLNRSDNNAEALQYAFDTVSKKLELRNDLSNAYGFTTTQSRYTANYRYDGKKVTLSLGVTAIDYNLTGSKLNVTTGANEASSRSTFRVVPAFRFAYQWTRTQRFQLNYNGGNVDPQFQQIQPFTDRSNPNNIVVGNPNLSPGFNHSINANYNNYIANSRFNMSFSAYANFYDNKITTNNINTRVILIPAVDSIPPMNGNPGVSPKPAVSRNINETNFINLGGSHSYGGGYSLSKQLDDRRYNISLNGGINYDYNTVKNNNILYHTTRWRFDNRFGPRINPNENIEINPYVGYTLTRSFATSGSAIRSVYTTTRLAIDGKMYFRKTYQVNYSASKNFVTGIVGATNPFIVNMGFQKEFFEKRNLVVTFDVYDLLYQNSFIRRDVADDGGVTNTISNTSSRYFMVGVRLNLQKWSGRPQRNGKNMQRRGDGSFIYN